MAELERAKGELTNSSVSRELGDLITGTITFLSGQTNKYKIFLLKEIFEENIKKITTSERVDALKRIFVEIIDSVEDHETSVIVLDALLKNGFKVGGWSKIRLRMDAFV